MYKYSNYCAMIGLAYPNILSYLNTPLQAEHGSFGNGSIGSRPGALKTPRKTLWDKTCGGKLPGFSP